MHLPTLAQEVYDVTGAGDTVIGVLAASLAAGCSLEDACFLANAGAGVVVGKLGTSTVSPVELENAIHARPDSGFGVMNEQQLKSVVEQARARGEKVVMTNGVFDILHAGHVSYLANARNLGDRLIVAVNSDASTRRLKGSSRPVNPLINRMTVLGALEAVDWVVSFEEDTPQRLIGEILPDLLVKGGDYKPEDVAGEKRLWRTAERCVFLILKTVSRQPISSGPLPAVSPDRSATRYGDHRSPYLCTRRQSLTVFVLWPVPKLLLPGHSAGAPALPVFHGCAAIPESAHQTLRG